MPFEKQMEELELRRRKALMMGGEKKIKKQHDEGKYTARERIDRLIDPRQTRNHIIRVLRQTQDLSKTKGISEHRLANWPTKF
ncbi:MAG: hypothetical protein Q7J01_09860 [Syntrophales bacterium]|nr:hypothetical protein [Syntrophales bacterium]